MHMGSVPHYDVVKMGAAGGWVTVRRNARAVQHFATDAEARQWIKERQEGLDLTKR